MLLPFFFFIIIILFIFFLFLSFAMVKAQALVSFSAGCYDEMPITDVAGNKLHYVIGVGFWAYLSCW